MMCRDEVIKVQVYGIGCNEAKKSGCSGGGCASKKGCSSCTGETEKPMTEFDGYENLKKFLYKSDVGDFVSVDFMELEQGNVEDKIKKILDQDMNTPIVVIDGIVRYYGGISNRLVYNDIIELMS